MLRPSPPIIITVCVAIGLIVLIRPEVLMPFLLLVPVAIFAWGLLIVVDHFKRDQP